VVVTADHGEAFGEHGMSWHGVELWEELVRVPWIMRVPGVAPRRVTTPRSQIDLAPTLLELLGLPPPRPPRRRVLGASLVGDLRGEYRGPRAAHLHRAPRGALQQPAARVVFGDPWKLTERGAGASSCTHLADDPGERTNLAATGPARRP
jgi:choline-sulfatase